MFTLNTKIAGIPCKVEVTHLHISPPDPGADSSDDYNGWADIEFKVLDRRGRPAPWLERKLSPALIHEIEQLILEHHGKY